MLVLENVIYVTKLFQAVVQLVQQQQNTVKTEIGTI